VAQVGWMANISLSLRPKTQNTNYDKITNEVPPGLSATDRSGLSVWQDT